MPRLPQNVLEIQVSLAVERSILVLAPVCRPVYPQYAGLILFFLSLFDTSSVVANSSDMTLVVISDLLVLDSSSFFHSIPADKI